MSFRLLTTRLFKHGRLLLQNYYKREIHSNNILDTTRIRGIHNHQHQAKASSGNLNNLANNFAKNQGLWRFGQHARRLFVDNILNRVTNPFSSDLRAQATKKLLFGDSAPFFALVGIGLASGSGILTKDDELEGVCYEIRDAVSRFQTKIDEEEIEQKIDEDFGLESLDIGSPIAKGSSAVVYAAALKDNVDESIKIEQDDERYEILSSPIENGFLQNPEQNSISRFMHNFGGSVDNIHANFDPNPSRSTSDSTSNLLFETLNRNFNFQEIRPPVDSAEAASRRVRFDSTSLVASRQSVNISSINEEFEDDFEVTAINDDSDQQHDNDINKYPLALKIMFNYDIESNAMSILKGMYKETVPARKRQIADAQDWELMLSDHTINLPPHPNIVAMYGMFCAQMPKLRNSSLYPMALPQRLYHDGYGRNMSLFLLMKRYNHTLKDYLASTQVNLRTRILLFAQLLEAIAHINRYGCAHRDLKSDNILIELNEDCPPVLVLTDFGCCLADKNYGLTIPYQSDEINKGGNSALMAPEIITKRPGTFSLLNYTKSDLWACGTISYEIFGQQNPFYADSEGKKLENFSYVDTMLPDLNGDVPMIIRKLIQNILQRNQNKRLSTDIAANVVQLYLWAPSAWLKIGANPCSNEILQWLLSLTTKILCEGRLNKENIGRRTYTEYLLISSFLVRAQLSRIRRALKWIQQAVVV
uniref:non-specific serine/threonine protein kinase n=1 Tax=Corethrella appendiculata TaxID=1370023 RepID=U5ENE0_9DIPT